MLKQILFALFAASLSTAVFADTNCTYHPEHKRMSITKFKQKLERQGYKIYSFDIDDHCYEIEGLSPKGQRIEAKFDMRTAKLVRIKRDDD